MRKSKLVPSRVVHRKYKSPKRMGVLVGNVNAISVPGVNALGKLEAAIMDTVWEMTLSGRYKNGITVTDIVAHLRPYRNYVTVLASTKTLMRKGLLVQIPTMEPRYLYVQGMNRGEYEDKVIEAVMQALNENHPEAMKRYAARHANFTVPIELVLPSGPVQVARVEVIEPEELEETTEYAGPMKPMAKKGWGKFGWPRSNEVQERAEV